MSLLSGLSIRVSYKRYDSLEHELQRTSVLILCFFFADVKKGSSVPSLLVFTMTAPIQASLDAKFCTEKCPDAGRNIEANFRGGLPAVTGSLALNIGSYKKSWEVLRKPLYEHVARYC